MRKIHILGRKLFACAKTSKLKYSLGKKLLINYVKNPNKLGKKWPIFAINQKCLLMHMSICETLPYAAQGRRKKVIFLVVLTTNLFVQTCLGVKEGRLSK